jgi:hypothetical protein
VRGIANLSSAGLCVRHPEVAVTTVIGENRDSIDLLIEGRGGHATEECMVEVAPIRPAWSAMFNASRAPGRKGSGHSRVPELASEMPDGLLVLGKRAANFETDVLDLGAQLGAHLKVVPVRDVELKRFEAGAQASFCDRLPQWLVRVPDEVCRKPRLAPRTQDHLRHNLLAVAPRLAGLSVDGGANAVDYAATTDADLRCARPARAWLISTSVAPSPTNSLIASATLCSNKERWKSPIGMYRRGSAG